MCGSRLIQQVKYHWFSYPYKNVILAVFIIFNLCLNVTVTGQVMQVRIRALLLAQH